MRQQYTQERSMSKLEQRLAAELPDIGSELVDEDFILSLPTEPDDDDFFFITAINQSMEQSPMNARLVA